jgi:hypothetical protein
MPTIGPHRLHVGSSQRGHLPARRTGPFFATAAPVSRLCASQAAGLLCGPRAHKRPCCGGRGGGTGPTRAARKLFRAKVSDVRERSRHWTGPSCTRCAGIWRTYFRVRQPSRACANAQVICCPDRRGPIPTPAVKSPRCWRSLEAASRRRGLSPYHRPCRPLWQRRQLR